jgi:predicted Zn-dependent peptidase
VYTKHPYKWPTIGKEIAHIQNASFEDVRSFFDNYYKPNNAIISIVGNLTEEQSFELIEKWFGDIPAGRVKASSIMYDESHSGFKSKTVLANVPLKAIVMAFMMSDRINRDFYIADLISDILSSGRSSRLYQELVKEKQLFAQIDCYVSGSSDPGMFIVEGKLIETTSVEIGKNAIIEVLSKIYLEKIDERELQKIKNKAETHLVFSELGILNKAMMLASFEHLGDIELINRETDIYQSISGEEIAKVAKHLFAKENCSLLIYEQLMTD